MLRGIVGYCDMKTFLKSFLADESGASAAEYALILVVVGIAIVAAASTLSSAIGGAMCETSNIITDGESGVGNTECAAGGG